MPPAAKTTPNHQAFAKGFRITALDGSDPVTPHDFGWSHADPELALQARAGPLGGCVRGLVVVVVWCVWGGCCRTAGAAISLMVSSVNCAACMLALVNECMGPAGEPPTVSAPGPNVPHVARPPFGCARCLQVVDSPDPLYFWRAAGEALTINPRPGIQKPLKSQVRLACCMPPCSVSRKAKPRPPVCIAPSVH